MAIALLAGRASAADRPNVVVIVADDFGYGDLGVHGCKDIPTPHMDSIAAGGVRCTNGYVSAPQCSPTRAGLLTGRYQQRFGHESNNATPDGNLDLREVTLADRLKGAGYRTGLVGKWHLGSGEKHHPLDRGFGEFFGFLGGANPYLPKTGGVVPRVVRGREPANEREFLTEAFARETVGFIDRNHKSPFFLYLAFNAPHGPLEAPEKYLKRFESIPDGKRRTYAAMVSALDDAVGEVLGKLRSAGLDEKTLVVFFSNNGGPTNVNGSTNAPFRGDKGETREGGIRTPFFLRWTGTLPAGATYDKPVIQLDVHPTALAAAGVTADGAKFDGVNLLPYLTGRDSGTPHEALFWRFTFPPKQPDRRKWAVRRGDWKLFSDIDGNRRKANGRDNGVRLVNLAADPGEATDLSDKHPETVKELRALWERWNAELAEPGGRRKD